MCWERIIRKSHWFLLAGLPSGLPVATAKPLRHTSASCPCIMLSGSATDPETGRAKIPFLFCCLLTCCGLNVIGSLCQK